MTPAIKYRKNRYNDSLILKPFEKNWREIVEHAKSGSFAEREKWRQIHDQLLIRSLSQKVASDETSGF